MKFLKTVAAAGLLAASSYAISAVTFDAGTGTGFVGKGDVQLAFGWNNAQLQANAGGISFKYDLSEDYTAVCTFTTGEGTRGQRTHNVKHKTSTMVSSAISYDARSRNQITGFTLKGIGSTIEIVPVPVLGGECPGNEGHTGTWSSVNKVEGSETGGLYVSYGGNSILLQ